MTLAAAVNGRVVDNHGAVQAHHHDVARGCAAARQGGFPTVPAQRLAARQAQVYESQHRALAVAGRGIWRRFRRPLTRRSRARTWMGPAGRKMAQLRRVASRTPCLRKAAGLQQHTRLQATCATGTPRCRLGRGCNLDASAPMGCANGGQRASFFLRLWLSRAIRCQGVLRARGKVNSWLGQRSKHSDSDMTAAPISSLITGAQKWPELYHGPCDETQRQVRMRRAARQLPSPPAAEQGALRRTRTQTRPAPAPCRRTPRLASSRSGSGAGGGSPAAAPAVAVQRRRRHPLPTLRHFPQAPPPQACLGAAGFALAAPPSSDPRTSLECTPWVPSRQSPRSSAALQQSTNSRKPPWQTAA